MELTRGAVREAMRRWRALYGAAPSAYDWSRARAHVAGKKARAYAGAWPAPASVIDLYGWWEAARSDAFENAGGGRGEAGWSGGLGRTVRYLPGGMPETLAELAACRGPGGRPGRVARAGCRGGDFLLERLGRRAPDLQGLRELTVNGLDAIAATADRPGRVVWDRTGGGSKTPVAGCGSCR